MTIYHEVCGQQTETVVPIIKSKTDESNVDRKIKTFLKAIREGGKAPVPSSQIIINQAIIDGLNRSARLGHEVEIDIPEV